MWILNEYSENISYYEWHIYYGTIRREVFEKILLIFISFGKDNFEFARKNVWGCQQTIKIPRTKTQTKCLFNNSPKHRCFAVYVALFQDLRRYIHPRRLNRSDF